MRPEPGSRLARRAPWFGTVLFVAGLLLGAGAHATSKSYALATAHPRATEAGAAMLKAGGNAFDAAVAVAATLAVVEPYGSGLGGGGFWLLHTAGNGRDVMLDGREKAPAAAHRDMFLDGNGNVIPKRSVDGALAAGIPGLPAALVHLAQQYGRLPLAQTFAPAIRAATQGFEVDEKFLRLLRKRLDAIRASPAAANIFLRNNNPPELGQWLRQPALAKVLRAIAANGHSGFYEGEIATAMVRGVTTAGGIWTRQDLADYQVAIRTPVRFSYRGVTVTGAALPSSGGIVMAQIFNILSHFDLQAMPPAQRTHHVIEAMRLAYRDRARHLGDADFVAVPTARLMSKKYAAQLAGTINAARAAHNDHPRRPPAAAGANTTHYSIIDSEGNRVAATLSLNYAFGSGVSVAGVLLNNEMDDFVAKPGVPNLYGLVGGRANAIAPTKRMLSSMSPTFIDNGRRVVVLGTPGGSRIITMVTLAILNLLHGHNADAYAIVSEKRFHHQYLPNVVQFEPHAFGTDLAGQLRAMGHRLQPLAHDYGNMQAVIRDRKHGTFSAAADPRGTGSAIVVNR